MIFFKQSVPNGFFVEDLIVYGGLEKGSVVSKGFRVQPPCLRNANTNDREIYKEKLRQLLQTVVEPLHLQVQWSCNSNYTKELRKYQEATERCTEAAIRHIRNAKFLYFWEKQTRRQLRREELVLFATIRVDDYSGNLKLKKGLLKNYQSKFLQLKNHFRELENQLQCILGVDTQIDSMDDFEHFCYYKNFLSPSVIASADFNFKDSFDPSLSIQENCLSGEGVSMGNNFYYDGHHHGMLAIKRFPARTTFGLMYQLTGLEFLDYRITLNIFPKNIQKEVKKEEAQLERLKGEYATEHGKRSLLTAIERKENKIDSLSSGYIHPLEVEYILHVWDAEPLGMQEKMNAIKQAINSMNGAQSFECSLPTTVKNIFFNTWPGFRGETYPYRRLYAEDTYLSDLMPFSASFTGKLDDAEALYDGDQGNLVGLKTFEGSTPQHAVLLGMSGAGKSLYMQDILEQTEPFYAYTAIIEEGLSYEKYTRALGQAPIVIQPDGELSINYFDTCGFPLSAEQIATAVTLVSKMIGMPDSIAEQQLRHAQIEEYIQQAYRDVAYSWLKLNEEKVFHIQKLAFAAYQWKQTRMASHATFLEGYSAVKHLLDTNDAQALEFIEQLPEADIVHFAMNPETERYYYNTIFSFFKREEFCQHAYLVELMRYATFPGHNRAMIKDLATLLNAWAATGQYGKLFDGVTNLSLTGKVAHFELGTIGENAQELKTACGLLITGFVRQHIITLPRHLRKRIIFEEVARLLDVPGGEKIVAEAYAQLRKFSCCATSIIQQYSKFKQSKIRPIIMGNAKQYWVMKQMDRTDLEEMAQDISLPEIAIEAIQQYPLPEHQKSEGKFSSICYYSPASNPPFCGTMHHVQLNENNLIISHEKEMAVV